MTIQSADSLVLLEIPDPSKVADVVSEEGWIHLSEQDPGFPADVPLYKSRQFEVGTAKFDPYFVTGQSDCVKKNCIKEYKVKVNLWYSPPNTDCQIHNHHTDPEMLEVHTQVHGTGRMQKFKTKDFKDLYEDVFMAPGFTHSPFTGVHETGSFYYGWHQYYSDTDCIWMANEFHPIPVQWPAALSWLSVLCYNL